MALVLCERRENVALVTLNDPDRRNVLSLAMNAELIELFDELETDPDVRAAVVTGSGPVFSAGGDLDDLLTKRHQEGLREIYAGFLRVANSPLPTVAAVNGPAIGAGMNFALACDLILAARRARFDSRFMQIAIHPGGGHTWRLRNLTDLQTVKAMVLFNEVLSAEDAVRVGLCWKVFEDAELIDGAVAIAARAATAPPELMARTKATIVATSTVSTSDEAVELEVEPQAWSMLQPEFIELTSALRARITKG